MFGTLSLLSYNKFRAALNWKYNIPKFVYRSRRILLYVCLGIFKKDIHNKENRNLEVKVWWSVFWHVHKNIKISCDS